MNTELTHSDLERGTDVKLTIDLDHNGARRTHTGTVSLAPGVSGVATVDVDASLVIKLYEDGWGTLVHMNTHTREFGEVVAIEEVEN